MNSEGTVSHCNILQVPTAGMLIGNSISGPAVAVDRLLADVAEKKHECETRLAFGANRTEAILPAMKSAVLAALIPNLNMMSVVGLVSIPGTTLHGHELPHHTLYDSISY